MASLLSVYSALSKSGGIHCVAGGTSVGQLLQSAVAATSVAPQSTGLLLGRASDRKTVAAIGHGLRRQGFQPLIQELPDTWASETHVQALAANARRVGSTFVVGVGCAGSMNIAKAVAARATNFSTALRPGQDALSENAALTTIMWPTMPTGEGSSRTCRIIKGDGTMVASTAHAATQQALVLHPDSYAELTHRELWTALVAGLVQTLEIGVASRNAMPAKLAFLAFSRLLGASRYLLAGGPSNGLDAAWSAEASAAAAMSGLLGARSGGGPADAIARVVADRYRIGYGDALASIGPEAIDWISESLDDKLADADDDDDNDDERVERGGVDASTASQPPIGSPLSPSQLLPVLDAQYSAYSQSGGGGAPSIPAAAAAMLLYRRVLASGLATPSLAVSVRGGLEAIEREWEPEARRLPTATFAFTEEDVATVAEAAEVEAGTCSYIVAPSTRQLKEVITSSLR